MSQVRNLRAMFENKGVAIETSSPDRGRSPLLSPRIINDSPRPLSKVRTNFVAVEKDGRIGLQLEGSSTSTSSTTDSTTNVMSTLVLDQNPPSSISPVPQTTTLTTITPAIEASEKPALIEPPKTTETTQVPESVNTSMSTSTKKPESELAPALVPEPAPAPVVIPEPEPVEPTKQPSPKNQPVVVQPKNSDPKKVPELDYGNEVITTTAKTASSSRPEPIKTLATTTTTTTTRERTSRSTHRSTASQSARTVSRSAPKTRSKTPGPSVHNSSRKESTPESRSLARKKSIPADLAKAQTAQSQSRTGTSAVRSQSRPGTSTVRSQSRAANPVTRTPASAHKRQSPSRTQSKSPIRPVMIPESTTGPTTAYTSPFSKGSCTNLCSASKSSPKNYERTSSHSGSAAPTLRRQSSLNHTNKKAYSSLGPPPKKKESSTVRAPREVDEGFLERMMRPTQSSQYKVTEKAPVTPPRKNTTPRRPQTRTGSVGARRDRSAPSSAQKSSRTTSRPASRIISPSRPVRLFNNDKTSTTRSVSKSSTGTQTDDLAEAPEIQKQTAPRKEAKSLADGPVMSDSVVAATEMDFPHTPEALPSLDTSMITSADMLDGSQHGERVERLLDEATEALNEVAIGSAPQKSTAETNTDSDVFGMHTKAIGLEDFETY